jgi:hypothetical protein
LQLCKKRAPTFQTFQTFQTAIYFSTKLRSQLVVEQMRHPQRAFAGEELIDFKRGVFIFVRVKLTMVPRERWKSKAS